MLIDIYDALNKQIEKLEFKKTIYPKVLEFHPVLNQCNLKCSWCIGKTDNPLKNYFMKFEEYLPFISSAYDSDKKDDWPLEIHICGNNSEPLLNYNFVNRLCNCINTKSTIEVITNGILLDKVIDSLVFIDKVSISLDVFNVNDFKKFKGGTEFQFQKILHNMKTISELRRLKKIKTMIYVTFVLDVPPNDYYQAYLFLKYLKKCGVNYIQFRCNYHTSRINSEIIDFINYIKHKFAIQNIIDYTSTTYDLFYIKFNEYGDYEIHKQCFMMKFWPIFNAMNLVYPCAHVANENNLNMAFKLELKSDYYDFWKKLSNVKINTCNIPGKCPSIANSINGKCNVRFI